MKAIIKPQYVDQIPKAAKGTVRTLLERKNETNRLEEFATLLELNHVMDHNIMDLSGTFDKPIYFIYPKIFHQNHFRYIH